VAEATYICEGDKTITGTFYDGIRVPVTPGERPIPTGSVKLLLSDGRNISVPQTISADGGRYANSDETFIFWSKGDTAFVNEGATTTFKDCIVNTVQKVETAQTPIGLANPASVHCSKQGGKLSINTREDGAQYGLCYFEDNKACEEWALMRGECPVGGVKTTGFDSIDQKYCAWAGGETTTTAQSVCTFKNGLKCSTTDFYSGKCSSSQ
jgi:putative hemolysin